MEKLKQIWKGLTARKWLVAIVAVCLLLVLWLAFSTPLLTGAANREVDFHKVGEEAHGGYQVFGALDNFVVENNVMQTVRLFGWVYCMSPAGDDETVNHVLAVSDKATYKLTPARTFRNDVSNALKSDMVGEKRFCGITGEFSPLGMQDGTYRLRWQAEENGVVAGTASSEYILEKKNGKVTVYEWVATQQEPVTLSETDQVLLSEFTWIEYNDDNALEVQGWAFMDGEKVEGQSLYLEVTDEDGGVTLYDTLKDRNAYVVNSVLGENYVETAFLCTIPEMDTLPVSMRIVLESGEAYYAGTTVDVTLDEDGTWHFTRTDSHKPAEKAENYTPQESSAPVYSAIDDIIREEDSSLNYYGWLLSDEVATADQQVFLELEDAAGEATTWTTEPYARPDLALSSGVQYAQSGFRCLAPKVEDPVRARMVVLNAEGTPLATPWYTLTLDEEGGTARLPAQEVAVPQDITPAEDLTYGVDKTEKMADGSLSVVGWAFRDSEDYVAQDHTLLLELTDTEGRVRVVDVQRRRRDDVAQAHGKPDLVGCGFEADVPDYEGTLASLRILVQDKAGATMATEPIAVEAP